MLTSTNQGIIVNVPVLAEESIGPFTSTIDRALAALPRVPYHPGQKFDDLESTDVFLTRQAHVMELTGDGFVPWEVAWIMQIEESAVQCILDHQD